MGEVLTVTHQCLDEVRVRRETVHPPPPSELSEWLQHAVTDSSQPHKDIEKRGRMDLQDQHE